MNINSPYLFGILHSPVFAESGHNFHNVTGVLQVKVRRVIIYNSLLHIFQFIIQCVGSISCGNLTLFGGFGVND